LRYWALVQETMHQPCLREDIHVLSRAYIQTSVLRHNSLYPDPGSFDHGEQDRASYGRVSCSLDTTSHCERTTSKETCYDCSRQLASAGGDSLNGAYKLTRIVGILLPADTLDGAVETRKQACRICQ